MTDPITAAVVAAFRTPGVSLFLAAAILLAGILLIVFSSLRSFRPLAADLGERVDQLHGLRGVNARAQFLARLPDMDRRFSVSTAEPALATGWAHFRSQLVETEEGVCGSFIEASDAFGRLDAPARSLEWWANIFVAIGLVITFLGIVAALTEATASIGSAGATGAQAQASLLGLLAIAATKFWTSIAGVLTSIILRIVARSRRHRIEWLEEEMFGALDSSVDLLSPQRVMVDQLHALSRIEAALARLEPAATTTAALTTPAPGTAA